MEVKFLNGDIYVPKNLGGGVVNTIRIICQYNILNVCVGGGANCKTDVIYNPICKKIYILDFRYPRMTLMQ